jgi:hypothetical protein
MRYDLAGEKPMEDFFKTIFATLFGGSVTFLFTQWSAITKSRADTYTYVDSVYLKILELYLEYPQFHDQQMTNNYREAYQGRELQKYDVFASIVHNFLETIIDLYCNKKGVVDMQWDHIVKYHGRLHREWLVFNQMQFEQKYVNFIEKIPDRKA